MYEATLAGLSFSAPFRYSWTTKRDTECAALNEGLVTYQTAGGQPYTLQPFCETPRMVCVCPLKGMLSQITSKEISGFRYVTRFGRYTVTINQLSLSRGHSLTLQMHAAYWSILILDLCLVGLFQWVSGSFSGDSVVCHVTRVVIIGLWQILSIETFWNSTEYNFTVHGV